MLSLARAFRGTGRVAGLALAVGIAGAAANSASATVCESFHLTAAQVAVFENGTWTHDSFQQTGPGQFTIARDPSWPAQVSLILRWEVNPSAHPAILPAASAGPVTVFLDYQYVADGFGTSFGAVAQANGVAMNVGARPLYFELGVVVPGLDCDLIRSDMATLTVTQPLPTIDPDRIPELACQGPGCDIFIRNPGEILINPGIQQILPQGSLPGSGRQQQGSAQQGGAVTPQQLVPQLQFRN